MIRIVILLLLIIPNLLYSQTYFEDAIRFSNTQPVGTARIQALGGASAALGADPSSILSNPAGLGLYNRSELAITPTINFYNSIAGLNNSSRSTTGTKFSLDQISGVFANPKEGIGGWLGGSWGFAVQKVNDFNGKISYSGTNSTNSLIDYFIENANGSPASDFPLVEDAFDLTSLAYYNYIIGPWNVVSDTFPNDEYFSDATTFFRPTLQQSEIIETSGSQYQITLGYGGNFADVFYFGFNVGLTTLRYESNKSYSETNYDYSATDSVSFHPLNSFNTTEKLVIDGTGANLTIGLILRPIPAFRVGFSISTPTVYALNDSYETTLGADWDNFLYGDIIDGDTLLNSTFVESAIIQSTYSLSTPTKYTLGAALFLGKLGFITLDTEFLNYGKTKLESQEFSMDSENDYIQANFSNQANIKAGVEIRLSPLRLRGGYALNDIPVDKQNSLQFSKQSFSTGAGLLFDQIYLDFALVYTKQTSQYSPYLLFDFSEPIVDITSNTTSGIFTLGFKF
jgi:hypothetical protein